MNPKNATGGFEALKELALDLRWSWNHGTDEIWRNIDSALWDRTRHPYTVLLAAPKEEIERRWADPAFQAKVNALVKTKRKHFDAFATALLPHLCPAYACNSCKNFFL